MEKRSIAKRIIDEKTVLILLVRGENPEGNPIFAYVAVRADKTEDFMLAQKTGTFYPEDFGVIIESGEGVPPPEIRKKMEDEYGFNHELMTDIPNAEAVHEVTDKMRRANPGKLGL